MTGRALLDASVVGRILSLHSAIQTIDDEGSLSATVARGLAELPGVHEAIVCLGGRSRATSVGESTVALPACPALPGEGDEPFPGCPAECPIERDASPRRINVEKNGQVYGSLFLGLGDRHAFAPYEPFIESTASLIALRVENVRHRTALAELNRTLRARARERTESQRLLASIVENSDNIAVFKDTSLRYMMANRSLLELVRRSSIDDVIGLTDEELFQGLAREEQIREYQENDRRAMELPPGEAVLVEERFPGRDGADRVFLTKKFPIYDDDEEQLLGAGTITTEITELKQAEVQLRLQSMVLNQIQDRVTVTDLDGTITYINDAEVRSLGYSREQLLGAKVHKYGEDPAHGASQDEIIRKTIEQGSWRGEVINRTTEGRKVVMDCRTQLVRDESGEPIALCGIATDITVRKQVEIELERLRQAIDQAAEAILITDAEGSIQYVNPAFEEITGYGKDEALGQNPRLLKSGEQPAGFYQDMWATLIRGDVWRGRIVNRRKDGTLYTEEAVISPVRDHAGETVNYVGVKRDVSAEIALENQLRQAQKMEAVGQLAGGVAHDFNNLLQVILGYGEMAFAETERDSRTRECLSQILKATRQATSLVSQLLAFSRRQVLEMRDIDLNDVVDELLKMLRRVIGEQISLDFRPGEAVGTVHADPTQIGQILANLCVNARDAMPEGGTIAIETRATSINEEFCESHPWAKPGRYTLLSVTDTGCGMDVTTREKAFEPFFTTKEVGDGTGLGLSTVYGLVKQHQGMVHLYSEPGEGTTFKIYLPEVEASEGPDRRTGEVAAPAGAETILVAEDEEIVRDLTRAVLERAGYEIIAAGDGAEALALFDQHAEEIDLAVLDVIMPTLGGRQVARHIRERRPDTPILFASGYGVSSSQIGFVREQGEALVQKPYSQEDLLRTVRELLDRT